MQITIHHWEIMEAIVDLAQKKYDMNINNDCISETTIEVQEREYAYVKYRNGQFKKDEFGHKIIDYKNSPWKTVFINVDEMSELHCHLDPLNENGD